MDTLKAHLDPPETILFTTESDKLNHNDFLNIHQTLSMWRMLQLMEKFAGNHARRYGI
jgi:hypothetical protein